MNHVYLNHGRWIANCAACVGGAEKLHPDGRIRRTRDGVRFGITRNGLMVCGSCGEVSRVQWPDDPVVAAVMTAVAGRPAVNRNWYPGEPVALLDAENIAHGLGAA